MHVGFGVGWATELGWMKRKKYLRHQETTLLVAHLADVDDIVRWCVSTSTEDAFQLRKPNLYIMLTVLQRMLSRDHLELMESAREKQKTGAIYVTGNFMFHDYYYCDGQSCVDEFGGTRSTHNTRYTKNMWMKVYFLGPYRRYCLEMWA
jgi:hypothetical protein